ncbi:PEP-CTERM domain protein [Massilia sp. CF038]|uniref:PEP-CTERM domain protein n=1 Tax=Massilia sp. CF038 TaxID=1881045 RepID=UPI00090F2FBE|nr:PEP-CTERM domain protein [Massilia sp. CF038]SHH72192.1 PEP-CTERM protein-sorting domain-containing protein [Massilia sp. CF038]
MINYAKWVAAVVLAALSLSANAAYIVGGATGAIASDSEQWAWDGSYMTGFRSALSNPLNFGPGGVVNRSIITTDLAVVDNATLSGVNMFVGSWNSDTQGGMFSAAVMNFFLNGGDLLLLQDDSGHDAIGSALGLDTSGSTGSDSNGGAPLYNGAFGTANNVHQLYLVGKLDAAQIAAHNGHIGGTNANGEITSAYWAAGEYAVGAGALFISADVDMIATTDGVCGLLCGAHYGTGGLGGGMDDNAIYALNTFSFLQSNGGTVPEPSGFLLAATALLLIVMRRRKA